MNNNPVTIWRSHKKLGAYLNKIGRILVWTKIFVAPEGFEHQTPYLVGIIQFENGERLPLQIVDCEEKDLSASALARIAICFLA